MISRTPKTNCNPNNKATTFLLLNHRSTQRRRKTSQNLLTKIKESLFINFVVATQSEECLSRSKADKTKMRLMASEVLRLLKPNLSYRDLYEIKENMLPARFNLKVIHSKYIL